MGKYSRDLDETLEKKVKDMALEKGLKAMGITVEAVRVKKCKTYGEVVKGNDLVTLFTNDPDLVCVALYEELFDRVDDETKSYWIESLLTQISYDSEKEKVIVTKPDINMHSGMYEKYKNIAVQKEELAVLEIQKIAEEKKEERDRKRTEKLAKKQNKQ